MKFLDKDLLLTSDLAVELYTAYAKDMPIIDYHSHLNPKEICEDKTFENIAELWLGGDHYKWRLMRNCGIDESLITGNANGREKFKAFAKILPLCIGSPIYIWCHLELKEYFGIETEINEDTADGIFDETERLLKTASNSAQNLIKRSKVELLCTTDDPADDLKFHAAIAKNTDFNVKVLPTFRPDKAVHIEHDAFIPYVKQLTGEKSPSLKNLLASLTFRLDFFKENGCFISDHALDNYIFCPCSQSDADTIFNKKLNGKTVSAEETEKFQTFIMLFLARQYHEKNIAMQLHYCALRNNNKSMYSRLGPDTGFDSINCSKDIHKLSSFLNALDEQDKLPKTIVYSLDPADDRAINSIIGCFQGGSRGKLQHGSAWWFNDTKNGMISHLKTLAEYSVLGNFIGMLTDSRSFTSYVRHDYFRRILCSSLADTVNAGEYPKNQKYLKTLTENVCYYNAKNFFEL